METSAHAQAQIFVGPGLSSFKRIVTYLGILGAVILVLWIALREGARLWAVLLLLCSLLLALSSICAWSLLFPLRYVWKKRR